MPAGIFHDDDNLHKECLRFCFMPILRDELYEIAAYWNTHSIRPVNNSETPNGRPDVLYYMPETQGHRNYKCTPENFLLSLEVAEETCCTRECVWSCSPEFKELASMIMVEEDLVLPRNAADAEHLYIRLLSSIELSRNA